MEGSRALWRHASEREARNRRGSACDPRECIAPERGTGVTGLRSRRVDRRDEECIRARRILELRRRVHRRADPPIGGEEREDLAWPGPLDGKMQLRPDE